jgi:hypothetical protein
MTGAYLGASQIGDQGGETIKVELSAALNFGEKARLRVVKLVSVDPNVYEFVAEALNGQPGETEVVGDAEIYLMTPGPDDPAQPKVRRFLRAYTPRLAPGIYYVQVERKINGTWTLLCVATPGFRVLRRLRHQEIYDHRKLFPSPPFAPGPQHLNQEPMILE